MNDLPEQKAKSPLMTKAEAQAFKDRWRFVNQFIDEEIRNTPIAVKLKQLSALYNTAVTLGWLDKLGQDEDQVWARWQDLRSRYAGNTRFVRKSDPATK